MGVGEIEAVEHSLRRILGERIPADLFREIAEEVEQGTLLGCVALAPSLRSLAESLRELLQDVESRIEAAPQEDELDYLQAVRRQLEDFDRELRTATEPLRAFLQERVVKGHFGLHDRFPLHAHDD